MGHSRHTPPPTTLLCCKKETYCKYTNTHKINELNNTAPPWCIATPPKKNGDLFFYNTARYGPTHDTALLPSAMHTKPFAL